MEIIKKYENTLHSKLLYSMPDHELLHGAPFKEGEAQFIQEHINYRHNARLVLQKIGGSVYHGIF